MDVLIFVATYAEAELMNRAIGRKVALGTNRNNYKVVVTGYGSISAASVASLELGVDVGKWDMVVSGGFAVGSPLVKRGEIVLPERVVNVGMKTPLYDIVKEFELDGSDDITLLCSDTRMEADEVAKYGKRIVFDTITGAIAQVADDYGMCAVAMKKIVDDVDALQEVDKDFKPFISYLESISE